MGDYSKLIVSCTVKPEIEEELKAKIEELSLCTSAYQSDEFIVNLKQSDLRSRDCLDVIIVGQTKWGHRQSEFCEWLRPHVIQGSGLNDVFAMSFSEYSDEPIIWKIGNSTYE